MGLRRERQQWVDKRPWRRIGKPTFKLPRVLAG
jgi:hypothetical protein